MNFLIKICLIVLGAGAALTAFSQAKKPTYDGKVKGVARDSVNNYVLQAATVSLYAARDSALLGYQLSNESGEFQFTNMPVGIPIQVVVSYSGYKNFKKEFIIPSDTKEMDLKDLNVALQRDLLDEVVVEFLPPVRMNGDTMEFNADAFKLKKNDVAEDLFRKLPGVTVWGDGAIFVNGKEVNNLLVDGKPFLGGDSKVAIQNLPKDAIDKVQIYQQIIDEQNPMDSTTDVNIKLKADKKSGKFGKIGIGYGSRDRFDAGGGMHYYSPGKQFTVVGAANNVNKNADNVNSLMRQGTFKNRGVDIEYQPNFRAQGLSRPLSAGFHFQRNYIDNPRWRRQHRLTGSYFIQNNERENLRETRTETTFTGDSSRIQNSSSQNVSINTNQSLDLRYQKENDRYSLNIAPALRWNQSNSSSVQESSSYGSKQGLQSTNSIENTGKDDRKSLDLNVNFNSYRNPLKNGRIPTDFYSSYSLNMSENTGERLNKTTFVSLSDPGQSKNFDRQYNNRSSNVNHSLHFSSGDLRRLLFGYGNFGGVVIRLQNNLNIHSQKDSRIVADRDTTTKMYVVNSSLSNETALHTVNERPGLRFSKDFRKNLAHRYSKNVWVNVNIQWQFYHQNHTSDFDFQNMNRSYRRFVPDASITYENKQYGEYDVKYHLSFRATSEYPSVNQLAPLVDSSNLYNIRLGNPRLQPLDRRNLSFSIEHNSRRREAMFGYKVNINAGFIENNFIDSSIIDESGRTTHYTVNADGSRYADANGHVNKSFKFADNQIQLNVNTRVGFSKNPVYVNHILNFSNNFNNNNGVNIYYTFRDIFALNLGQNLSFSRSLQSGLNKREFGTNTKTTTASGSYNISERMSLSSNISFNRTTSTGSENIDFTIWNANLNYRFLEGNNAEIKLSGLDLLRQNISVIHTVNNNTLTTGVANVLQNYYMVTLSYYPRSFGRGGRRGR